MASTFDVRVTRLITSTLAYVERIEGDALTRPLALYALRRALVLGSDGGYTDIKIGDILRVTTDQQDAEQIVAALLVESAPAEKYGQRAATTP